MAKPPKVFKKGNSLASTIEYLNSIRVIEDTVNFKSLDIDSVKTILKTFVEFDKKIVPTGQAQIISKTIFDQKFRERFTPASFERQVVLHQANYINKPREIHHMYGGISSGKFPFKKKSFESSEITFAPSRRLFDVSPLAKELDKYGVSNIPQSYATYSVTVRARTIEEAFEMADNAIDHFRAIWNFTLNRLRPLPPWYAGRIKPVNILRHGPFRAMFNKDHTCASIFSYDVSYTESKNVYDWAHRKSQFPMSVRKVSNALEKSSLREICSEALLRYCRALDHDNNQTAFLELWSTLELLTGNNSDGGNHQKTMERACAIYPDRNLALAAAEHLRIRRNQAIHETLIHHDSEMLVYQLKHFVEELLRVFIFNKAKLSNFEEAIIFLDMPRDVQMLKRRVDICRSAIKMRGK